MTTEKELAERILTELEHARQKFPSNENCTMMALIEEVGELGKAVMEESNERVASEAIQVAVMAMRVVLDGDYTMNKWRRDHGLADL